MYTHEVRIPSINGSAIVLAWGIQKNVSFSAPHHSKVVVNLPGFLQVAQFSSSRSELLNCLVSILLKREFKRKCESILKEIELGNGRLCLNEAIRIDYAIQILNWVGEYVITGWVPYVKVGKWNLVRGRKTLVYHKGATLNGGCV